MKPCHIQVTEDEGWFVGRVLEREGITTQGRSLDELVFMVRDAIEAMWNETGVHLELIIPPTRLKARSGRGRKVLARGGRAAV